VRVLLLLLGAVVLQACATNQQASDQKFRAFMRGKCMAGDATACAVVSGHPIPPQQRGFTCKSGYGDEVVCTPN